MRAKVCNKYAHCGPVRREYATPLWCRPMIKFLAWQEESGLWPKIAVVSVCWQQQVASRHSGSKAARSSSFFPITNYAYAMLDCNWWQGRTPHTAHSSRSPWPHLKLPLQALAQNFACHTCVCNCHAPPTQAGQRGETMMMRANFHYELSHVCSALACLLTCLELGIIIKCCQQQQPSPPTPPLTPLAAPSCAINNGNCLDLTPASLANRLALQTRDGGAPACVAHFAWAAMKGSRSPLNALPKLRHVSWFTRVVRHMNHSRDSWHLQVASWRVISSSFWFSANCEAKI